MANKSQEFIDWMAERQAELEEQTRIGPVEVERILAQNLFDALGMVLKEYNRTHD